VTSSWFFIPQLIHAGFWWGNLKVTDRMENLDVDGKIILNWILKN